MDLDQLEFKSSDNINLHFQFTLDYIIEEMTNKINNYIKENKNTLISNQTIYPQIFRKMSIATDPINLWRK